ncbi:hypothetical protein JXR93_07740 [bacterium]|nr:hypothetical protein [bacterium]
MEFGKKWYPFAIVFTLIISAILSGKIVNQIVANKLIKPSKVEIKDPVIPKIVQKSKGQTRKTSSKIVEKNIFNSAYSFVKKEEVIKVEQIGSFGDGDIHDEGSDCIESQINTEIKATMPAEPHHFSYFGVIDNATKDIKYYKIGDEFIEDGVFVYDIYRSLVILDRNGVKECLYANRPKENKSSTVQVVSNNVPQNSGGSGSRIEVQQTGPNSYEVSSDDLSRELKNLNTLSRDARIIPSFDKDNPEQSIGFKVFAIKRNTLFEKIGLKNGDVITSINGMPINSPDKALEIYSRLIDGTSSLKVDLIRGGKPQSMDYSIK